MLELRILEDNRIDAKAERVYLRDNTGDFGTTTINTTELGQPIPITSGGTIPAQTISIITKSPTGYGSPNLNRNQLAVFPVGYLINAKGSKTPLLFDSFDPLTSTKWSAIVPTDGWLSFVLVYCQITLNPVITNYGLGEMVYSITDSKLLKVVDNLTDRNKPLMFVEAKAEELLVNNQSSVFDQLFIGNSSLTRVHLLKRFYQLLLDSENLSNSSKLSYINEQYKIISNLLEAAIYEFVVGNKYESARIIEFLLTNNYNSL